MGDTIPDYKAEASLREVERDLYTVLLSCTHRQQQIIHMRIAGAKQIDIAKALDISQAHVSRELKKLNRKINCLED